MKSKRILWFIGAVVALAGAIALLAPRDNEPSYQGKRLSEWLSAAMPRNGPNDIQALYAVRQIGTNGIPWLVQELDSRDGWLRRQTIALTRIASLGQAHLKTAEERHGAALSGFAVLGPQAWPAIPALAERLQLPESANMAAEALREMAVELNREPYISRGRVRKGDREDMLCAALTAITNEHSVVRSAGAFLLPYCTFDSPAAVPALIRGTKDSNYLVRILSVYGLGRATGQPVAAIPELIAALGDSNQTVRAYAASSLGSYHRQAKTAVPYLMKARSDPDKQVRDQANRALEAIDPETAAAIPDLPDFKPLPAAPREAR